MNALHPSIAGVLVCIAAATAANRPRAAEHRPNVLVIVSDDQGYRDAGFQRGDAVPTPPSAS